MGSGESIRLLDRLPPIGLPWDRLTAMKADFERAREVFLAAAALDSDARRAFLDAECAGQPEIRAQVEAPLHGTRVRAEAVGLGLTATMISG